MQVVISGSIPDVSKVKYKKLSSRSSIGRAGSWSDLGCKFNSYLEHIIYKGILYKKRFYDLIKVVMELVDMNSLGLFDYLGSYPFKSDLPYRLFVCVYRYIYRSLYLLFT